MEPATAPSNGHPTSTADGAANGAAAHGLTPPYWKHHQRGDSNASLEDVAPAAISLEDHTEEPSEQSGFLWAKNVAIDDYVVVSGSTGLGAYVVYNCVVETLDGAPMTIRKRYSEFDALRRKLIQTFPHSEAAMPLLPPKSAIWRTQQKFLEKRRIGLCYFLNCVLLNPEFSGAPVLKEFIFS